MISVLYLIIVGVVAGILAKWVIPNNAPYGLIGDFVVGIVGATIGGLLFNNLLGYNTYGGLAGGIGVAFVGAVIFLFILRAIVGKKSSITFNN